ITSSLVSTTTRHTSSVSSDWSASRRGFGRRRNSAVAVTFEIFTQSLLALHFGNLPNDGLAQQQDRLDLLCVGHVERDVLRASLRVAPQPFDDLIGRAYEVKIVAVARLFRGELTLIGSDQDSNIIRSRNGLERPANTLAVLPQHFVLVGDR